MFGHWWGLLEQLQDLLLPPLLKRQELSVQQPVNLVPAQRSSSALGRLSLAVVSLQEAKIILMTHNHNFVTKKWTWLVNSRQNRCLLDQLHAIILFVLETFKFDVWFLRCSFSLFVSPPSFLFQTFWFNYILKKEKYLRVATPNRLATFDIVSHLGGYPGGSRIVVRIFPFFRIWMYSCARV